jgi:hypothetical protein
MLKVNSTTVQQLFNVNKSIRCFDVNISMDKAAIVDDENKCSFFDMKSKKLLFQVSIMKCNIPLSLKVYVLGT